MTSDLCICTKNRYPLLLQNLKKNLPKINYEHLIIVDSTLKPNYEVLEQLMSEYGAYVACTPNAKIGFARNSGLYLSREEHIYYLDDDILVSDSWASQLKNSIGNCFAVSGCIIKGYNNDMLSKVHKKAYPSHGAGHTLFNRKHLLRIGGWDSSLHLGEDTELYFRSQKHHFTWLHEHKAICYHPYTLNQWVNHGTINGLGLAAAQKKHLNEYHTSHIFLKRFAGLLGAPIIYGLKFHPKMSFYCFKHRLNFIKGYAEGLKKNDTKSFELI